MPTFEEWFVERDKHNHYPKMLAMEAWRAGWDACAANCTPAWKITAAMVYECMDHVPTILAGDDRLEWIAERLNAAMAEPSNICPCCGVSADGKG